MSNEELYSRGLVIVENFLTSYEELELVNNIPETPQISKQNRNSIRRYGSNIPYKNQIVSTTIPDYLDKLCQKIVDEEYLPVKPNSVSINEYLIGNSIAPHIDSKESGEIITIISLLSDADMMFSLNDIHYIVHIPARSLMQLKNEIRYNWKHSILPVQAKRYSIVFRNG